MITLATRVFETWFLWTESIRRSDPSRTPSRPRRPVFDNPRGQLPGTGIRRDAENLCSGNLYGGSAQGVSGNSSGGVTVTVLVKKDLVCFQIQEIVFHFSIHLRRLWRHLVQQRGMSLSIWELMSF